MNEARLLAGGQSLIATLNMRLSAPRLLVDINGIGGLDGIARKDGLARDRRHDAPPWSVLPRLRAMRR